MLVTFPHWNAKCFSQEDCEKWRWNYTIMPFTLCFTDSVWPDSIINHYFHFPDEKTEKQRGDGICPRLPSPESGGRFWVQGMISQSSPILWPFSTSQGAPEPLIHKRNSLKAHNSLFFNFSFFGLAFFSFLYFKYFDEIFASGGGVEKNALKKTPLFHSYSF